MKFPIWAVPIVSMLAFVTPDIRAETYRYVMPGEIIVTVVDGPFLASEHHVRGCGKGQTCVVDHAPALVESGRPRDEIKSISIGVDGMTYALQASGMFNTSTALRNGGIKRIGGYCYDRHNCAFRGRFGDGGRSYVAEWVIKNGIPTRTVLSPSMDLGWLFDDNPMPPKYE
ncbi:hypothetical protein [Massilia genomosp. 1]|uniref:Uncharacterized protein n=1 Tax=Massilia genomosp. 1 TaxID=2609280 RepID=A0ABX0MYN4_9BURK|nr:hypothetical protein [Massilia genomosp. 1]NHZ67092.1 hypothetical protein [Massilia genomosp. 1]